MTARLSKFFLLGKLTLGMGGVIGAIAAMILVFLFLVWAILWIVFPVFVYFGMNRLEKILIQIELNSRPP